MTELERYKLARQKIREVRELLDPLETMKMSYKKGSNVQSVRNNCNWANNGLTTLIAIELEKRERK